MIFLFIIFFSSILLSEDFILQNNLIPISINNQEIKYPFFGGFNQPRIQWLDWDLDNDIDLFIKDDDKCLRYFENIGDSINPDFNLISTNYNDFIIGNWFIFEDFDSDGDIDLVTQNSNIQIGSYSVIMYYENIDMDFYLINESLMTQLGEPVYSELVSTPTFIDIDNDGDLDFFSGNSSNGSLTYYENIGYDDSGPIFNYITNYWQEITIIGGLNQRHGASAITFIDLDGDSDLDLSWGDYFQQSLYIIWNIGNLNVPIMDINNIIIEFPQNNPIETAGQNMPSFADLDGDNDNDLFVTVLFGAYGTQYVNNFFHYENTGTLSNPYYEYITSDYLATLDFYTDSSPDLADIDNDGDLDFFVGTEIDYSTFPFRGRIKYFQNSGSNSNPYFNLIDPFFLGTNIGTNLAPELIDIDNDNDNDMFIGEWNGKIKYFKNEGTPENFNFDYIGELEFFNENGALEIIDLSGRSAPRFVDIDNDNDLDLFIGTVSGTIAFYENTGTSQIFEFTFNTNEFNLINVEKNAKPEFIDIDNDNDYDLLIGSGLNGVYFYRNIGNINSANFIIDTTYNFINGQNISPVTGYLFNSSSLDIIFGLSTGGLYHALSNIDILGDINDDGIIDLNDLLLIINSILFNDPLLINILFQADYNQDNELNIFDIILVIEEILND